MMAPVGRASSRAELEIYERLVISLAPPTTEPPYVGCYTNPIFFKAAQVFSGVS